MQLGGRCTHPQRVQLGGRNVTVSAALGRESILDFEFKRSAVELCNTCTVRFESITVSNEGRAQALTCFWGSQALGLTTTVPTASGLHARLQMRVEQC